MERPDGDEKAMKIPYFLMSAFLICFLGLDQSSLADQKCPQVDWPGIRAAYLSFVNDPSPRNGQLFITKLPKVPIWGVKDSAELNEMKETHSLIIDPIDHSVFRRMVQDGNDYAVEAVFRLVNISRGAGAEMLFILLGDVMREHPRLYLEILDEYKDMEFFKLVRNPVGQTAFPLGSERDKAELQARIDALETVNDEPFRTLRDDCIMRLREALNRRWKDVRFACSLLCRNMVLQ